MSKICDLVQNSLETGYLTLEAEQELRRLLQTTKYGVSELNTFADLQYAGIQGLIRQESRELLESQGGVQDLSGS